MRTTRPVVRQKSKLCATLLLCFPVVLMAARTPEAGPQNAKVSVSRKFESLPLAFEKNEGQAARDVKFLTRGSSYTIGLKATGALIQLDSARVMQQLSSNNVQVLRPSSFKAQSQALVEIRFAGASRTPSIEPAGKLPGVSNYLLGHDPRRWLTAIPRYSRIKYRSIYPGIDAVFYGSNRQLEFDFLIAPGADLNAIDLNILKNEKRAKTNLDADGSLSISTETGVLKIREPQVYEIDGHSQARRTLEGSYVVRHDGGIGFRVKGYNGTSPLVIDPVLAYSTYLGGTGFNQAYGIAVDSAGDTYITGYTSSVDFPGAAGLQANIAGGTCDSAGGSVSCFDAFVAKINPEGTALVYSTYLGGTGDDRGIRIAVDSAGEAYITGDTASIDFPEAGAVQSALGGGNCGSSTLPEPCYDAFLSKLDASGSSLIFSTYLGGTGSDFATGVAVDSGGNAYVSGFTSAADFPVTPGALQTAFHGGGYDGFVSKFNASGQIGYSTYLGGSGEDHANDVAVDSSGEASVTGQTNSADFPAKGGFQPAYAGGSCGSSLSHSPCFDAFISKLNAAGSALVYSSYLGGTGGDYGTGVVLDSSGNSYVTGWTTSSDFPLAGQPFEKTYSGAYEAFVAKVNGEGDSLDYSTYLGGINPVTANSIAVNSAGEALIAGTAYGGGLPIMSAIQSASGGIYDGFVAELTPAGSGLVYLTYLGGSGNDAANDIALDASGNLYIAGDTFSTDFPTTPGAFAPAYSGGSYDAWIAKVSPVDAAGLAVIPNPVIFPTQAAGTTSAPVKVLIQDAGSEPLVMSRIEASGDFAETGDCSTVQPGTACSLNVTFTPTAAGNRTGLLTLTSNVASSPQSINLQGNAVSGIAELAPASIDFGPVLVGSVSASRTITLTNTGAASLSVTSIQAQGDFVETNNCGNAVAPGTSCSISVSFSPVALGLSAGAVVITDTAEHSPQTVTLSGTGAVPSASLSSSSLTFDAQPIGTTSPAQTITLSNGGEVALSIAAIKTTGDFAESDNCGTALAAGAQCTISVTYDPQQTGAESGTLSISDNAAGSPQTVALSGTGMISITLAAKSDSVTVLAGTGKVEFTISASVNGGPVTTVALGCENISPATCTFDPATLAPGGSSTLTVANLSQVLSNSLNFTVTGTVAPSSGSGTSVGTGETVGSNTGTITAMLPLSVLFADFKLSSADTAVSIGAGQTAHYTLSLDPVNGFDLPVSLSCQGAPAASSCSVTPAQVTVAGPVNVTVAVATTARSSSGAIGDRDPRGPVLGSYRGLWLMLTIFLGLILLARAGAMRQSPLRLGVRLATLILLSGVALASCGGGGASSVSSGGPPPAPSGTPAGTYTLTIQAGAQSLVHSTTLTLEVQ